MAIYSKSLEDYFRIPVLVKPITPLTERSNSRLDALFFHRTYPLPVDDRYLRHDPNPNTDILKQREQVSQKFHFMPEDFENDWPEFQIIYKAKFAIAVIDENLEERQIDEFLGRIKLESNLKLIGILDLGAPTYETLIRKENFIKLPELNQEEFTHFIEPWLYNCLALVESDLCNMLSEARRDDDSNKTIVFNRMEEKFEAKIMKRKKRYRCIKLSADYCLMLQLYKEAFDYFNEAEESLRKIDDYLWILGCLQGKLACLVACPSLSLSNQEEYIQELINETYLIAKKVKNWNFECENYFKVARLYLDQPQKFDELIRSFILNHGRNFHEDEKFLLFTTVGNLYERCGLLRKKNYYYFLAALIHLNKRSELSSLLLIEIQKAPMIKEWPELYKKIVHMIIQENAKNVQNNEFYLELLSRCANTLSEKEIARILSELNYSNNFMMELSNLEFIKLQEFKAIESAIKPKQNRIGNRESPRKVGGGFFMSWKRDENLLYEENELITFKGTIANRIPFPIRLKLIFETHSLADPSKICSTQEMFLYLQPNNLHKFEAQVHAKGETEEIWVIDRITIVLWNFSHSITLNTPVKYEIYEKQPELELMVDKELKFEESTNLRFQSQLYCSPTSIPFCLIKLNISLYYSIDVGFQQNEIVLRQDDNFRGIDFKNSKNLNIRESKSNESVEVQLIDGILHVQLKKLKAHRKFVTRIEFTIEYIRSMSTKYQIFKHIVSKCTFFEQFLCSVEEITTPMVEKIYKNSIQNAKIIEKDYKLKLKIKKLNQNTNTAYKIRLDGHQYEMSSIMNELIIQKIRQKLEENNQAQNIAQKIQWESAYDTNTRGQLKIEVPFNNLMRKSQKAVTLKVVEAHQDNNKKIVISYQISSTRTTNMSHQIILNPIEIEIDRMYVIRGKTKIQQQGSHLNNQIQVIFGSKCRNSYQIRLLFKDGWNYWHQQLINLP